MRYSVSSQQFDHFRREGEILLEELFKPEEIQTLQELLEKGLENRPSGRDLQSGDAALFKAMHLSRLGQVARGLLEKKLLRLAFTQYKPPFLEPKTLIEISSVTDVVCGILFDFNTPEDILFFGPEQRIDFSTKDLLIAFSKDNPRYKIQQEDPHTHFLKTLGYAAGDQLSAETHPFVARY